LKTRLFNHSFPESPVGLVPVQGLCHFGIYN